MIPARLPTPDSASALALRNTSTAADALNAILADLLALYFKTKNFHWHMTGPHFRDYHLMLDEQATELFSVVDDIAERVRKTGNPTLRSIGDIARRQTIRVMIPSSFRPATCSPSSARITSRSFVRFARRKYLLMKRGTTPPPDFSTPGLIRRRGGPGFCSKPHDLLERRQFARRWNMSGRSRLRRRPLDRKPIQADGDVRSPTAVRRLAGFPVWFYGPGRQRREMRQTALLSR